jgi:HlyD family secretion protein
MRFVFQKRWVLVGLICCLLACSKRNVDADAFGSFESDNMIISAQSNGIVLDFAVREGQSLKAGDHIATIDTTDLVMQKKKLELQLDAFLIQNTSIPNKFKTLQDSLLKVNHAINNIGIISKNESIQNEWDSFQTKKKNLEKDIDSQRKTFSTQVKLLAMQAEQLYLQLQQLNDVISKCKLITPVDGTVLTKYTNTYELVGAGFPIVRIADLSQMNLKVYVTEDQLSSIELGATCSVYIDDEKEELKEYQGVITWISSESEFTPKMIQTKKERVNLVYAVKIKIENDSSIKTGMPGEVVFH